MFVISSDRHGAQYDVVSLAVSTLGAELSDLEPLSDGAIYNGEKLRLYNDSVALQWTHQSVIAPTGKG